jgi:hypothetical protein
MDTQTGKKAAKLRFALVGVAAAADVERAARESSARTREEGKFAADGVIESRAWEVGRISHRRFQQGETFEHQKARLDAARDKRARRKERNLKLRLAGGTRRIGKSRINFKRALKHAAEISAYMDCERLRVH